MPLASRQAQLNVASIREYTWKKRIFPTQNTTSFRKSFWERHSLVFPTAAFSPTKRVHWWFSQGTPDWTHPLGMDGTVPHRSKFPGCPTVLLQHCCPQCSISGVWVQCKRCMCLLPLPHFGIRLLFVKKGKDAFVEVPVLKSCIELLLCKWLPSF